MENGGRNGMLLVRICWGPARGGFGFRILDFEFVWDLNIGISDFLFWLRPRAALRIRVRKKGRVGSGVPTRPSRTKREFA